MRARQSIDSEDFATTYQCLEVARLNRVLRAWGVERASQRRAICEDYFFDQGQFIDNGWFSENERRVGPVLAYAERDAAGDITELHLPPQEVGSMYHEYAHGAVDWLFDEKKEDAREIATGEWL